MNDRPRFGVFPNVYLGIFVGLLLAAPYLFATPWKSASLELWIAPLCCSLLLALCLVLSNRQCSSSSLSFREGLLFVTTSMMTGWSVLSAAFVFPALLITVATSVAISIVLLPFGGRTRSAPAFFRLVKFFHRHRMLQ
ncbi:hypothetical protein [Lysobacter tyrosinilyticus]